MIVDVPTADDFRTSGVAFLNLAWDAAVNLSMNLEEWGVQSWDDDGSVTDEYWRRAQQPLATALALAQQGAEFLLKAQIAAVSPYLLLSGTPRDWPKGCDKNDAPYSAFHSIDAQDLPRGHDAVASKRLSTEFRTLYEQVRRTRNSIFHTVDRTQRTTAKSILLSVLEIKSELIDSESWVTLRKHHLGNEPDAEMYEDAKPSWMVARELRHVIDLLTQGECKRLLSIPKKQRLYFCPACGHEDIGLEDHVKVAQLRPNTRTSTGLFCHACEEARQVVRKDCNSDCPGNVIDDDEDVCLACGEAQ